MKKFVLIAAILAACSITGCVSSSQPPEKETYKAENGIITRYRGEEEINIVIPEAIHGEPVTALDGKVFIHQDTILTVAIPAGVTEIGPEVFSGCEALTEFIVAEGNRHFTTADGVLFSADKSVLVAYPQGKEDSSYTVPEGTVEIAENALENCNVEGSLQSITLPASLRKIGDGLLWGQNGLTEIITADDNQAFTSIDGVLFSKDQTALIKYPPDRASDVYTVPDGVRRLQEESFLLLQNRTEKIILPETIEIIGDSAFGSAVFLKEINIPANTRIIENGAFSGCVNLKPLIFPEGLEKIGNMAFNGCFKYKTIFIPSSVERMGRWAFSYGDIEKILCGAPSKPSGWKDDWTDAPVQWGADRP